MRTREEVLNEIDWREKELERLKENLLSNNQTEDYNRWRIGNLSMALEWCKWFLNEK